MFLKQTVSENFKHGHQSKKQTWVDVSCLYYCNTSEKNKIRICTLYTNCIYIYRIFFTLT